MKIKLASLPFFLFIPFVMKNNSSNFSPEHQTLSRQILKRLKVGINVILVGLPGIGKSQFCENYLAKELQADFELFHPVMANPAHLMGLPFQVEENGENLAKFLPLDFMRKVMNATKTLLVLIDDVGQATPIMQAALMQLVESRIINGKKIPDCVKFILATNDVGMGAGVTKILAPLKSRTSIFKFHIPVTDWIKYMEKNENWHRIFSCFFTAFPQFADKNEDSPKCENTGNRRNWSRFAKVFDENDFTLEDVAADVGNELGKEFLSFFQTYKEVYPIFKKVETNWKGAEMFRDMDQNVELFALISALVHNVNPKNAEIFGAYLYRYLSDGVNKETAFFGIKCLAEKEISFQKSKIYTQAVALYNS